MMREYFETVPYLEPKFIATYNHLIADTAYKLSAQVLTPFRNRGQLEEVITSW